MINMYRIEKDIQHMYLLEKDIQRRLAKLGLSYLSTERFNIFKVNETDLRMIDISKFPNKYLRILRNNIQNEVVENFTLSMKEYVISRSFINIIDKHFGASPEGNLLSYLNNSISKITHHDAYEKDLYKPLRRLIESPLEDVPLHLVGDKLYIMISRWRLDIAV